MLPPIVLPSIMRIAVTVPVVAMPVAPVRTTPILIIVLPGMIPIHVSTVISGVVGQGLAAGEHQADYESGYEYESHGVPPVVHMVTPD